MGHKEGDQLIKNGADLIKSSFGDYGEVYRIGGDEFVVIFSSLTNSFIESLLVIFSESLQEFNINEENNKVGIAWGTSSFISSDDKDLHSVLVRADKAMYECKRVQKSLPA